MTDFTIDVMSLEKYLSDRVDMTPDEYREAYEDGELDARLVLQSFIEHGSAMTIDDAVSAFSGSTIDQIRLFIGADSCEADRVRLFGYLGFFGKVLWEQTEAQRKALDAVSPLSVRDAKVIPLVRSDGQKRRQDGEQ